MQTVYNLLEQDPGRDLMAAAAEHGVGVMARVPTSSGLLDDNLTPETTFGPGDHRRHRPREWLVEGLQKIERIRFLCGPETGRTMAQAALRFILAQPQMTVVIPTITNQAELREYAGAADVPDLTEDELARVAELYERNFDVEPGLGVSALRLRPLLELRRALVDVCDGDRLLDALQVGLARAAAAARRRCRRRRCRRPHRRATRAARGR